MKPTLQVAVALAVRDEPDKVTAVGAVAAAMITAALGLAAAVSL